MNIPEEADASNIEANEAINAGEGKAETVEREAQEDVKEEAPADLQVEEEEKEKEVAFPLTSPTISMSAGADPWADPSPVAAMASAISTSKRTAGDNPWATNTSDVGVTESSSSFPPRDTLTVKAVEQDLVMPHQDERWGEFYLPKLGNVLARYWSWKPGFLQLNNGKWVS